MKVKSISHAGKADVFNMEVEDTHDFVIQGGALTDDASVSRPASEASALQVS